MSTPGALAVLRLVLRNRDLRRVLLGYLAFHIAEFATWVAILLYAYEQTGPASVGVVALAQLVPAAFLAAPAAALGDRFPRQRVLTVGYLLQAVAMMATAAVMAAELPVLIVYIVAAAAATSLVVTRPTQSALLPALSRTPDELTASNGAAGVVEGAGITLGPLIAALILTGSTVATVFVVAGAALVAAALVTVGLRPVGGLATVDGSEEPFDVLAHEHDRSFFAGLRTVAADPDARLVMSLLTARMVVIGCADVLFVLLALDLLETGEPGAGILNAALGAGTMLGGALTFWLVGREAMAIVAALGALAWGGSVALVGLSGAALIAPLAIVVGGAGLAIVDIAGRTILQRNIRDEVLARVFGIQEGLAMAGLALGAVLVSGLVEVLGLVGAVLAVAAILPAVAVLSWSRLRAMDRRGTVPLRAIRLLRSSALFRPLPVPQLESVARRGVWLTVEPGTVVIRQGDPGDRYFVLADGSVSVAVDGTHVRDLSSPGQGFGEIALLRDVPRTATVTASTPTILFAIDRAAFLAAVTGHPDAYAAADAEADQRASTRA